jgi:glycolate oxidase iron-sulfur subunit
VQTTFTQDQLAQPEVAEADGILKTCVHYGFCTGTCPTYVLFRDENDSPRGRIDLIRAMLEKGGPPDPKTVHHLDRCLSCFACMTTCAVKVDYAHLIDIARSHIERTFRRPWADRLLRRLLALTLPYPRRFLAALLLARAARPFVRLMPGRLPNLIDMTRERPIRPRLLAPGEYRAEGKPVMRVALLTGCAQQALDRNINVATIRVLQRHGCTVLVAEGAGCCGALPLHMGFNRHAKTLASANVEAWSRLLDSGLDSVVVNASGCGTTVKDYGHLLGTDAAERIAAMTRDITEILATLKLSVTGPVRPYRVAYHDACSLQHGQRVIDQPRQLLKAAGFNVLDVPEKHFCCGSAGTYNLLQPEIANALGQRKATHVESVDPDIIAAGNLGCMVQIGRFSTIPIVHTVELIDWATGGSMPEALRGRHLRERAPPETPTAVAAITPPETSPSDSTAIW